MYKTKFVVNNFCNKEDMNMQKNLATKIIGVFKKYRKLGIGTVLLQVAEQIAKKYADTVIIGVGLHRDYGSAQRMYIKHGFIPDGSGIWWQGKPLAPYADLKNDDELALYMSKKI